MNAMILAAGLGTRLGALGAAAPKVLIDVGGRPLLAFHLQSLERLGVSRVVINTHHRADQLEAAARAYAGELEIVCVRERELLGTAGGVRNALQELGDGPFLILYGDVLVREPLDGLVSRHRTQDALATIALHEAPSAEGKGVVEIDDAGSVRSFLEKGGRGPGPFLINSGLYVLERAVVEPLEPGTFSDFGSDVFPSLLGQGATIAAYQLERPVIDIGTPEGLAWARESSAEATSDAATSQG